MHHRSFILCVPALLFGTLPGGVSGPEGKGFRFCKSPLSPCLPARELPVHLLHDLANPIQACLPLMAFSNTTLTPAHLDPEASRNCAYLEEKRLGRKPEFLLPDPLQALQAVKIL